MKSLTIALLVVLTTAAHAKGKTHTASPPLSDPPVAAAQAPAQGTPAPAVSAPAGAPSAAEPKLFEVAPKVGFFKTTTSASGAFFAGAEVGLITPVLDRRLEVVFEANWHMPSAKGTLTSDRLVVDGATADGGYTVLDREFGFLLSAVYRLPDVIEHLSAYAGLGPSLTYHRETVFGFGSTTVESESSFGFQVLAGAEHALGPGAAFLEVHYHFTNVDFLGTGKVNTGGFLAAGLGYRLYF